MPEWSTSRGSISAADSVASAVLDGLPDGVVVLDRSWTYRFVNEPAARILHTEPEHLLGNGYYDLYPEAIGTPFERAYVRVMTTGEHEVLDDYYAPWDQYFRNRIVPYGDGIAIFFSDVTEEHRRGAEQARDRALLRQVVDFAPISISLCDLQGRYALVNRYLAHWMGSSAEQMIGFPTRDFRNGPAAAELERDEQRVRHTGSATTSDLKAIGPDGAEARFRSIVFPTFDSAGALNGTGVISYDLTPREEADRRVRATEQRYRSVLRATYGELLRFQALVESCADFIAIAGLDGRVEYLNPGGRAIIRLPETVDVTDTTITDYLTPEGIRTSTEVEQPAVLAAGWWSGESTLKDQAGGPPIPVAVTSFLMRHPETKEPIGLATVQRDIRERVEADEALKAADAQRHALLSRLVAAQEQERTRIAADVHDDPVQSLAAVDLRLGILHRRLRSTAPAELPLVEQVQETVSGATDRLRELLFDLEPTEVDATLEESIREVAAHLFEDEPVAWTVRNPSDLDLGHAERVKAVRIVKEALRNVRLHARASNVVITLTETEGGAQVTIVDDGVGVRGDALTSPPGHRGITSMRDHAAIAGGWLNLGRAPGGGTELRFWLPGLTAGGRSRR